MGKQAMSGAEIDNPAPSKIATDPASHFPRLIQLLTWQASGMAHGPRYAMKERVVRKTTQIPIAEASTGRS